MRRVFVIGIGAGNPDYVTVQAINALNEVDVFFVMDKGHEKEDLVRLRRECERCGREFGCSRDGIADCWCNAEPYRLLMPPRAGRFGNCLCPNCLREFAAQLRIPGAAAGT